MKPRCLRSGQVHEGHPLTGGCGLKHRNPQFILDVSRSPPHGGVWIETRMNDWSIILKLVTPSRGGVD